MASTKEQKTAEEAQKGIDKIAKLLEMHGANPAEVKKEKKERKDLIMQEQDLMNKYTDVLDEEKKELAKKTQTFKSMSGFIGIEARKYFTLTKENHVTFGGLAGAIKTGIKDWFKSAMQQRTALGATLRLGASLWKATHDHIITRVKDIFGKIGSQVREVLGDVAEVFDVIKGIFTSTFKFLWSTLFGVFEKVPPHQRKRNVLLRKILAIFQRREKVDLIGAGKKKVGGGNSALMIIAMIAAGILGAFVRRFFLPFEMVYKAMKMKNVVTWVKGFLGKFTLFGRIMRWFNASLKMPMMLKLIMWSRKFKALMPMFSKSLGLLFGAFKVGFKFLGWPLTILLAVIDFVRGFVATEGNLADKILGGLKKAVFGFIELPVRFFGWVVEKVLGLFGIKADGIADKILGGIEWILEGVVSLFRPLFGFFEGFFSTEGDIIDKLIGGFKGWLGGMLDFFNILSKKWDDFASFFGFSTNKKVETGPDGQPLPKKTSIGESIVRSLPGIGPIITYARARGQLDDISATEANSKKSQQEKNTEAQEKSTKEQTKELLKGQEKIAKENPNQAFAYGSGGMGGAGGAPVQDQTVEQDDGGGWVYNQNEI